MIELPGTFLDIPESGGGAHSKVVTDTFRGAASSLSDVTTWTAAHGAPVGWDGGDADAAAHAMTRITRRVDYATAALEKATTAADTYVTSMTDAEATRVELNGRGNALNADVASLRGRINGAPAELLEGLEAEAAQQRGRADKLHQEIGSWEAEIVRIENTFIQALQSVDSTSEGVSAANADGRVDTSALAAKLRSLQDNPDQANSWWESLTPAQREALKISDPDLVGNTNGLPTGDRDDANRASMTRDINLLNAKKDAGEPLSPAETQWLKNAEKAKEALDLALTNTDPQTGEPVDGNLLVFQPTAFGGDGAVAVSYGDPDTADNTAVVVPGLTNDGSKIASQGEDAMNLYLNSQGQGDSTATIAWMGYDAPSATGDGLADKLGDFGGVSQEQLAENGGHLLSDFVDGLRASDTGEESHLTVIGHSYGSTTAAHAATDGLDADKLVLIGSPGAGGGSEHVSDLNMPDGTVYVGSAENDPVTWLGRDDDSPGESRYLIDHRGIKIENPLYGPGGLGMGEDPSQASFGAKRFDVADGKTLHVDNFYNDGFMGNHVSYLDANSESLDNISTIVKGNAEPDLVEGRTKDANDYATDWAKDEAKHQIHEGYENLIRDPLVEKYNQGREVAEDVYNTGRDVVEGVGEAAANTYGTGKKWVAEGIESFKDAWP